MANEHSRPGGRQTHSAASGPTTAIAIGWAIVFLGLSGMVGVGVYYAWMIAGTIATALAFTYDKLQAKRGGWRVPEKVLHGASLLGGVLGGWFGMLVVHHKTRHHIFWVVQISATIFYGWITWMVIF